MATRRKFIGGAGGIGAATFLGYTAAQPETTSLLDAAPAAEEVSTRTAARDTIRAVNAAMRTNYAALKADLVKNLGPVIVVQNDAKGGTFTLVHEGKRFVEHPVAEEFELAKSIAHVPLGIFSTVAEYLSDKVPGVPNADRIDAHDLDMVAMKGPGTDAWTTPLQAFADKLTTAKNNLTAAKLPQALHNSCAKILDEALTFIADAIRTRAFDIASFQVFAGRVYPAIRVNMQYAAEAQISGVQGLCREWRAQIGEAAWADLYTVVLSIWTTSVLNQAEIIIKPMMNQKKVDTHLIDIPTAQLPSDPIGVALDNLARIVQDNIAAELVFVSDTKVADALKGKEDLLSDEILKQLGTPASPGATGVAFRAAGRAKCPVNHSVSI
ncbi:hypothetical protein SAMN04487981_11731 [Streptomyces sp. cf386]|uniref:hypothetical protein n=1 Tax=Streptomyces sp. cf386 TaxID=1761904 RepID=UPI00088B403C|nr:hypothetical protein [Streptomyces sp. cf386]SDP13472.1 hypothetical protein SAMN04487981_11731 [Streptomyces sp. cf386]